MLAASAATIACNGETCCDAPLVVDVALAAAVVDDGDSPSVFETLPRRVLSSAQMERIPLTTEGRSSESASRNDVWLVLMKLWKCQDST